MEREIYHSVFESFSSAPPLGEVIRRNPWAKPMLENLLTHDPSTFLHSLRAGRIGNAIARFENVSMEEQYDITLGATLHDIGKIFIHPTILRRPVFTRADSIRMEVHTRDGFTLVASHNLLVAQART